MLEIQQRASGPGESAAGVYISIFENFCLIYWCLIYFCLIFVSFVGVIIYKVDNKYIVAIDKRENLCRLLV